MTGLEAVVVTLRNVALALGGIEVRGEANLDTLLTCMRAVRQVAGKLEEAAKQAMQTDKGKEDAHDAGEGGRDGA